MSDDTAIARPFYFFVVFWGERYRRYVANILLRSLLAPGNFPMLSRAAGHKFLICCPKDDWCSLQTYTSVLAASQFVEFIHVAIEPPPPGRHPVDHMGGGHRRAATLSFEAKAYGSLMHPDMIYADGFIKGLLRHVELGTQVLHVPALRYAQEPLFAHLDLDPNNESAAPLTFSPRKIVAAAIESLHDEIVECELHGPRFSILPNCVWWCNGNAGMIVNSFAWSPVLIDYASIPRHELEGLRGPLTDGDYIARNFSPSARIVFVSDSDEITYATWTPSAIGARERRRSILQNLPVVGIALRHALLRRAYLHYTRDFYPFGDHVKAEGFKKPLILHTGELGNSWGAVLDVAANELRRSVGDLFDPPIAPVTLRTRVLDWMLPSLKAYEALQWLQGSLRFIIRRVVAAMNGDVAARTWIYDRVRARLGI